MSFIFIIGAIRLEIKQDYHAWERSLNPSSTAVNGWCWRSIPSPTFAVAALARSHPPPLTHSFPSPLPRDVGPLRSRSTKENTEGGRNSGRNVGGRRYVTKTDHDFRRGPFCCFIFSAAITNASALAFRQPHDNANTTVGQPTSTWAAQCRRLTPNDHEADAAVGRATMMWVAQRRGSTPHEDERRRPPHKGCPR